MTFRSKPQPTVLIKSEKIVNPNKTLAAETSQRLRLRAFPLTQWNPVPSTLLAKRWTLSANAAASCCTKHVHQGPGQELTWSAPTSHGEGLQEILNLGLNNRPFTVPLQITFSEDLGVQGGCLGGGQRGTTQPQVSYHYSIW